MQAVTTGAYRAVEFIKANIKLDGVEKASVEDSKKVVEICTQYAQKGMFNIFLTVFFSTLAFAFVEPYFFIGYLISIALFGLYQAMFMANAGGAWDNAKKIVEVELKAKGTPLHAATVVGDTVGDPFKDTSSVALNPVIKFTTLFGLLAVELAVQAHGATPGPRSATCWRRCSSLASMRLRLALVLRDADRRRRHESARGASGHRPRLQPTRPSTVFYKSDGTFRWPDRGMVVSNGMTGIPGASGRPGCRFVDGSCGAGIIPAPTRVFGSDRAFSRRLGLCRRTCSAMSSSHPSRWDRRRGTRFPCPFWSTSSWWAA